jgi:hypothetical protein
MLMAAYYVHPVHFRRIQALPGFTTGQNYYDLWSFYTYLDPNIKPQKTLKILMHILTDENTEIVESLFTKQ